MRIIASDNIGETRAAVMDGERAIELHIDRWSENKTRVIRGEVFRARVKSIDNSINGAFCDLGRGPDGFLPFGGQGRPAGLHVGAAIGVQIAREAFQSKGPTLSLFEVEDGEAPETVVPAPPLAERLSLMFDAPIKSPSEAGVALDDLFDEALEKEVALSGGGRLIIEPTAALTAIDVDAAGKTVQGGAAKLALELNKSSAKEAARQIRLRGLGGVIAIDFLPLKKKADQGNLVSGLKAAFRNDPAKIDIAPPSRFGIVELARQRVQRPLHEVIYAPDGRLTVESAALKALRRLEAEGTANRSKRLVLSAGEAVHDWLVSDAVGWKEAATNRLGPRFELVLDGGQDRLGFDIKIT